MDGRTPHDGIGRAVYRPLLPILLPIRAPDTVCQYRNVHFLVVERVSARQK